MAGMKMEQINIAPGPDEVANIIRLVRDLYKSSSYTDRFRAFELLEAGWPHMQIGNAVRLLNGVIELGEALDPYYN